MPADASGSAAPKASIDAPRAVGGPKLPPRPARPAGSAPSTVGPASAAVVDATVRTPLPADDLGPPPAGFLPPVLPAEPVAAPVDDLEPEVVERAQPAPVRGRRTRRGRRVKRVVRRIDLWSVLKLSLIVYTCLYLSVLGTLAGLWTILYSSGSVERLQSFLADVGLDNFTFYGDQMFRAAAAIGGIGVLAATVITVLATALVNVISEMTGGIRLVVIEEDVDR